jgi:hypothetical protein
MYAELLLLLYVLPGFFFVSRCAQGNAEIRDISLGILLLAMSVWIKSEGLLYFSSAVILLVSFTFLGGKRRFSNKELSVAIFAPALVFIAPWALCRWRFGLDMGDFDLSKPISQGLRSCAGDLWLAALRALRHMFINIKASGGIWIFISIGAMSSLVNKTTDWKDFFIYSFVGIMTVYFVGIFFFSSRPADWHVEALPRLLLVLGTALLPFAMADFFYRPQTWSE